MNELKNQITVNISDFALEFLISKGFDTADKIDHFVKFSEKDIPDVSLVPDADKFVERLIQAISNNERIVIYGDYDADGICATTIAMKALRRLKANVSYFVNNRFEEGYGINEKGMNRLMDMHPDVSLILTVDNGILGFEGINIANEHNIDVIVSDHHEPKDDGTIPNAVAMVDLKRIDVDYPHFKELCGAGLIYKLMNYLYAKLNLSTEPLKELLAFVAVATIADLVPLLEENRYYVRQGLKLIKEENLYCFNALRSTLGVKEINEETMGFRYGPILNAIGRLDGDVSPAIELFLTESQPEADRIAESLDEINEARKELTLDELNKVKQILADNPSILDKPVVVIMGEFHEGVAGIIAGKVKEEYGKPSIVLSKVEGGRVKGSARSVKGFNLKASLDECKELLIAYGGHEMAAGLTLLESNFDAFVAKINTIALQCNLNEDPVLYVDFPVKPEMLSVKMVNDINTYLRPFGQGFEKPVIGMTVAYDDMKIMKDKHLKFVADNVSILWFNGRTKFEELGSPLFIKCIGMPDVNVFNGRASVQFLVQNDRLRPGN